MRVLHLTGTSIRRGGETFAADLTKALRTHDVLQREVRLGKRFLANARSISSSRPDVIQAHGGEALKRGIAAAGLSAGRPSLVYRRIGSVQHFVRTGPRHAVYGWLMRRADRVIAVSEAVREETINFFGVRPEQILSIPNGIDPLRLSPTRGREATRESLGIPSHAPVTLSLGALTWEKHPEAHLEVAARVINELPEAIHLFVGEGPQRLRLEAAICARGLQKSVRVLGERSDIGDILAVGDVMVLASRTEGMPGCLIEAGMVGMPVAAYAIAGVPEVVGDGVTGFLVPPGRKPELARSVIKLLVDSSLRSAIGEKARERCLKRFHIDVIAPQYLRLYRELVEA